MRTSRYTIAILTVVALMAFALVGGGCKPATPSPGDEAGSASGGTGGSGAGTDFTGPAGQGLPVDLPSGLLAFGLRGHVTTTPDGSIGDPFDVLTTVDQNGQNLCERFALSPNDRTWKLSPDGTKLATYREVYDSSTGESKGSFYVYDLAAATVTPLALPPQVWALASGASQGDFYFWSGDSRFVLYTYIADVSRGDNLGPPNLMVSVARAPADGSAATFTDIGYGECVFAPISGRDAIIFAGPYRDSLSSGSDIMNDACLETYDFQTGSASTVCSTANPVSTLAVSFDGRFAAYECEDDMADGAEVEYAHCDLSVLDLRDGAASFIDDHTDKPTSIFARSYLWSPAADVLAVILETKNSDDTTVNSVYFYHVARSQKTAETTPISKYDLLGMAWSVDGQAFFIAFGTTIYRVDAATGQFAPIFTTDTPGTGLAVTP